MSKLGIVIIEDFDGALRWAIQNKPTAVEFMLTRPLDDQKKGLMRDLAVASPKTLLVIRAYPDDYDHGDFQDRMLAWSEPFREVSDRVVAHSVNEVVPFNEQEASRLNTYEVAFIERMVAHELIPMCFCLSESHFGKDAMGLWGHMALGITRLAEAGGFLGLNEYDWPNWDSSRDQGYKWRSGHWEKNLEAIRGLGALIPRVGIGESVLDGKIWTSRLPEGDPRQNKPWGYRRIKNANQCLADIRGIEADSYSDPRVAFFLLFAWAPGHRDWKTYDVSAMKETLAEYLRQSPPIYWEPKEEEPMDIWENVPPQIARWKKLIGRVTREYPVPIPDYQGVAVSPAKVVACIIRRESNGDPNIVNPDSGATGLMQIMPFHFKEGQDPKDPDWNVRKGLSIFAGKIAKSQDLYRALFWYSGKVGRPEAPFIEEYWEPFVGWYKEFWGVDLEPQGVDYKKKYEGLRNGVVAAINTLQAVLDA